MMQETKQLQDQAINTIRFLSADAVQQANSGHPGLPMGTAPMAYAVWTRHLRHNPANPAWANRDRFVLSGGHGSMLLYSLLYLTGYDLALEDLQQFRQWGSRTPGHPEYGHTPGVEATTGPLGQGFANGVGMAMAEAHLAAVYNRPGHEIIDHTTYAIVTDGDLMEGVASEAASLAGHLRLGKLIYLYDDNRISIEGSTNLAFTEDRAQRFAAYGWHVQHVADGLDVEGIDQAIQAAKLDPRPSLIVVPTIIGYGLPTRQGTAKAHGEPPGDQELNGAKEKLGWPQQPRFYVPDQALAFYRQAVAQGAAREVAWQQRLAAYRAEYPELAAELERRLAGRLPAGWADGLPQFPADAKGLATRASSGKVLNAIAERLPDLMGGSADLAPSTATWMNNSPAFAPDCREGRNIHFGVREHGMGAVVNGLAYHGGVIPFDATFFVFSDYMRPVLRLAAMSHLRRISVFTHDSVGVGEDGPTHQPIEHLAALRAIPGLIDLRPADANEAREAWIVAPGEPAAPHGAGADPPEPAHAGALAGGLRRGRGLAARRLRAEGLRRRRAAAHPAGQRLRGQLDRGGRPAAGRARPGCPSGLLPQLGAVRRAGRSLPGERAAGGRQRAAGRGGWRQHGLVSLGRRAGPRPGHRPLRRVGPRRRHLPGVRPERGQRRAERVGTAMRHRCHPCRRGGNLLIWVCLK
jgi:transketolase